ncbi:MFS transporter, partial [Acetobacter tropicalis]|uniref:MFS transporter n=1 Tax=Acetobacter tropicalis TaxID=104102 RepID=UPI0020CD4598
MSVAAVGSFMAQLDATIVNVSLPDLVATLHAPFSHIQWVVSGYLLALALTLPLNGWLVSRLGGRAVYLWCFGAFTLTSGLCALASSAPSLIVFRLLQGMAGGLLA